MSRVAVCILCGTNAFARPLYPRNFQLEDLNPTVFSARRLPDRLHEKILRCTQCGLVYAEHLIDPALLSGLYEQSAYTYRGEEIHIQRTYGRYLRRLFSFLGGGTRPLSFLDIGAGNGFMLEEARAIGFQTVAGVEPSSHAIASASSTVRPFLHQGLFPVASLSGRTFDAITCFQTLDHIPDPVTFVRDVSDALAPGGGVLFINHNIASLPARLLGERCPMIDIEHTFLHTPSTMRTLFARAGFSDITVFRVRNDYPLSYWVHLLPVPLSVKSTLATVLRVTRLGALIVPFYPGNLGLIARKV